MDVKTEILKKAIYEIIEGKLDELLINREDVVEAIAIIALSEIKDIVLNDKNSKNKTIKKISDVLKKYGIDTPYGDNAQYL